MNSLKEFFKRLLPSFDRSRVIEDIDSIATNIESNLAPNFKKAAEQLRGKKLVSRYGQAAETMFHLRNKELRGTNHISHINDVLPRAAESLKMIERLVPEIFARDVTKDSLTYKRATILQFLGLTRFVMDFAGKHLLVLLADEAAALLNNGAEASDISRADRVFLTDNLETFIHALKIVGMQTEDVASKLGTMQDLQLLTDRISVVAETLGPENVDPLRLNLLGLQATASPIYWIRSSIASYQDKNHKRQIEETKALQLRLYALKDAQSGRNDPRLQSTIGYTEDRLSRLKAEIDDYQASLN